MRTTLAVRLGAPTPLVCRLVTRAHTTTDCPSARLRETGKMSAAVLLTLSPPSVNCWLPPADESAVTMPATRR